MSPPVVLCLMLSLGFGWGARRIWPKDESGAAVFMAILSGLSAFGAYSFWWYGVS